MNNKYFNIKTNSDGIITHISNPDDKYNMNWVADDGKWGGIHCSVGKKEVYPALDNKVYNRTPVFLNVVSATENEAVYEDRDIRVTVKRFFENDRLTERYTFKNLRDTDLFTEHGDLGILLPFNDVYTYAEDCLINHCNTHIWCGYNTTYINALRMGKSDCNLGLVLTQGSIKSYSVYGSRTNIRGQFLLNLDHLELGIGEEYTVEWQLFWHSGNEDFISKLREFETFVEINATNYTVYENENIEFEVKAKKPFSVFLDGEKIDAPCGKVLCKPKRLGEHRFEIRMGEHFTYAEFFVSEPLLTVIEKRIDFIINNQQYKNKKSHLDGAFLIYDLQEKYPVFDSFIRDHNACRERMGMPLLIIKYLQKHQNKKVREALDRFVDFLLREMVDVETGEVFDGIMRNAKYKRLYNAPWITTLFTELYILTQDRNYLTYTVRILRHYYSNGGLKFYPNGLSMLKTLNALKQAGMTNEEKEVEALFTQHVDNIVHNGLAYPKHEVNFEQTIVTPAATFLSEMAYVTGKDIYKKEAEKHIETLVLFNGRQPSYHLHEIPIRFWDDRWFGKSHLFGDTFPHYWSCLSSRALAAFYRINNKDDYISTAEKCIRNCLCLFNEKGEGSCAYVYPFMVNCEKCSFYDKWANDQDFSLYFYLDIMF